MKNVDVMKKVVPVTFAGLIISGVSMGGCSADPAASTANTDASTQDGASSADAGTNSCGDPALLRCGDRCVDSASDLANCGACGTACAPGEVCSKGVCGLACGGGTTKCDSTCKDLSTDAKNCGACGTACATGQVCTAGTCALTCGGGTAKCGSSCVDTAIDSANCGGCGVQCGAGRVCSNGTCAATCSPGLTLCDSTSTDGGTGDAGSADGGAGGACVDTRTSRDNCGSCGIKCGAGQVCNNGTCQVSCQPGLTQCGNTCVDPLTSRTNCGATDGCGVGDAGGSAGTACGAGQICSNGTCQLSCQANLLECGGTCVDPNTNRTYCGATGGCGADGGTAGTACTAGQVCVAGACQASCGGGQIDCGGTCVDPQTSRTNCGATSGCGVSGVGSAGATCATGNVCSAGTCQVSCVAGQIDCGGVCISPDTSRSNCGATAGCGVGGVGSAGATCTAGNVCSSGTCQPSCGAGLTNCSGTCTNTSTDPNNCGGCGAPACATGANASAACGGGRCGLVCNAGFGNCNGLAGDGCEKNLNTDVNNCGACGSVCAGFCVGGTCYPSARFVYRADGYADTTGLLQKYTVASDTWTTVTSAPAGFRSTMGTDGTSLYAYLSDNTLRAYSVAGDTWSLVSNTGPASNSSGFLRSTPGGVYFCPISQSTMYRYQAGVWTSFTMPASCASSGTFHPATGKLYVRVVSANSFMVVDSAAGTVGPVIAVSGFHNYELTDGAYYSGFWYTQDNTNPIMRADAVLGGAPTSTGLTPASRYSAMATDFGAGVIFLSGWGDAFAAAGRAFVRYDPVAGTLTNLASAPTGVNSEANLTAVP